MKFVTFRDRKTAAGRAVRRRRRSLALAALVLAVGWSRVGAQTLRFEYGRDLTRPSPRFTDDRLFSAPYTTRTISRLPPSHATLRLGPFYSSWYFTQSAGYRYVRTRGTGIDFLSGRRRSVYKEDGSEFPLISTFDTRNYVLITRNMDLDLSISARYAHYPLGTQEDEFYVTLAEEGIYGNLSMGFDLTPFVRAVAYDAFVWRTDYVDTRGFIDEYGGSRYEYMQNTLGLNMDWQFAKDKDVFGMLSREDFIPRSDAFKDQERVTYHEGLQYEQQIFIPNLVGGARATLSQNDYKSPDRPDTDLEEYLAYLRFGAGKGIGDVEGLRLRLTRASTAEVGLGYSAGFSYGAEEAIRAGDVTARTRQSREAVEGGLTGYAKLTTWLLRNLVHELQYRRGLRLGFDSAFEMYDEYSYRITWQRDLMTVAGYSVLTQVYPSWDATPAYSTWTSGADASYPLTERLRLLGTTIYTRRQNEDAPPGADIDEEWRYDYQTWLSRLGTGFAVTPSISFTTYGEHVVRWSDSDNLEFTRDTFEAFFTYRHAF